MPRIGFVVNDYPKLSETFIAAQVQGLQARGFEVTVLADRLQGEAPEESAVAWMPRWRIGAPLIALHDRLRGRAQGALASLLDLLNDRQLNRFDLLIVHFGPNGRRLARSRRLGILRRPFLTFFHGYDVGKPFAAGRLGRYRGLYRTAARLLPVSEHFRRILIESGAPPEKTHVHRMGIDSRAIAYRPELPKNPELRLLSVARLVEKKGIDVALRALGELKARRPQLAWQYHILGEGPLRSAYELLAGTKGIGFQVHFHGATPHAEITARLREADLFLLPSVTAGDGDLEGIPVALMEAMAAGVPVLSSVHSGIPELIEDGKSGFLIAEHDEAALAARIEAIADGKVALEPIRQAARRHVEEAFENEVWNDRLAALIRQILAEAPAA